MSVSRVVTALVAAAIAAPASSQDKPRDPASVQTIQVSVSVREGNRPVTGLAAADFELTDNGVRQQVEASSVERLPIDVTLIVDTNGSTTSIADKLTKDVEEIARLLSPSDAFRLLRIDTLVHELRAMAPVRSSTALAAMPRSNGASAVHDALIAGLMQPVSDGRRHLVVAVTDVLDTMSATTADRVREVAARSEGLLQIVTVRPPMVFRPARSFVRPRFNEQNILILTEAAERTGGELRGRGFFGDADLVPAFKKVLDDFRQSYVLRYSPRQVETGGWHELSVSVPKAPTLIVRARTGYPGS